ncbi:MAG: PD-(D/E)XK nuclease family protein, partial [Firmicutes bacterium]|nr:PD-(D/E)XK nuclease family protein [Bacillota bacterium]
RKTAKEITTAIYTFLVENKIEEKLNKKIEYFKQINESFLAEEYEKSYEILIDLLDEIVLVFGVDKMTFTEYNNVLQTGFKYSNLGKIPEVIDQIVIGDVDRSRTNKTKVLFITGLNDGVFPSSVPAEGFLNDKDRNMLRENGIELAKTTREALYEDQFNIYKAFSTAEEKVYLSYLSSDKNGRGLRPSILVSRIKRIFPKLQEQSDVVSKSDDISMPEPGFENLLANLKKLKNGENIDKLWLQVYNWYAENSEWNEKLARAASGLEYKNKAETLSKDNIEKLYGDTLKTSISRLEQYKKCPFSFYLKYGLKIEEKEQFKIRPIDTGSFMHEVIDEFFETVGDGIVSAQENDIAQSITEIIDEKLNQSKNYIFTSTPKFIVLTKRLKQVIIKSLQYIVEQMKNSSFRIIGNEVEFKDIIGDVELTGKIDRIDIGESGEGKFIRVIDYKSSSKNIDLNEMMSGTSLQLITYIDSIAKKEDAVPAGMLYFNLIDPVIKSNKNLSDKELEDEIRKKFKMQGLILADVNVIKMMDTSLDTGSSKSVPVSLNSDGTISKTGNSTITKEEFTNLQKSANRIIQNIAEEILKGNIDIKPIYNLKTKTSSCKNCIYKSICGFDANYNSYEFVKNKSKDEILEEIKEE